MLNEFEDLAPLIRDDPDIAMPESKNRCLNGWILSQSLRTHILMVILVFVLIISNSLWCLKWRSSKITYQFDLPDAPKPATEIQIPYQHWPEGFGDLNISRSNSLWAELFPTGGGRVLVQKSWAKAKGLLPSVTAERDPSLAMYSLAGYHQLHCLTMIRAVLAAYYTKPDFVPTYLDWKHAVHCMDILRQHIICQPDDTLMAKQSGAYIGDRQMRSCKDFSAYKAWAEAHRP